MKSNDKQEEKGILRNQKKHEGTGGRKYNTSVYLGITASERVFYTQKKNIF